MEEKIKRSFSASKKVRNFKGTSKEQGSDFLRFVKGMGYTQL